MKRVCIGMSMAVVAVSIVFAPDTLVDGSRQNLALLQLISLSNCGWMRRAAAFLSATTVSKMLAHQWDSRVPTRFGALSSAGWELIRATTANASLRVQTYQNPFAVDES
jgi:hypothetical protein